MHLHPERPRPATRRPGLSLAAAALAALILAGCTAQPVPSPSPSVSDGPTTAASPTASEDPAPTLDPEGSADDNLPFFAAVVAEVWATPEQSQGRAYIDALTAAGFDRAAMQVTNDVSTVGNAAESIQFSVQWGDECLVGQVGPATGAPVAVVVPALETGGCLIGATRPIDW
ncbi:hypothetical protein GCM10009775_02330 [Microbacterium aoyamense]|uniref:DUF6993 domain-containing protein n=1 Tax=Microbacterium aoyamense TaxID=344166 RepID=A0ABP5AG81_9MICO|nr:hypothetical protein [Microbacterium aoyamense]